MISVGTEDGMPMDSSLMLRSLSLQVSASTEEADVSLVNTTLVSLDIKSDESSPETLIRFPSFSQAGDESQTAYNEC